MHVRVERDYEAMSLRAARIVADLVQEKPGAVLGLATGSTPEGMYSALIRIAREEGLDFSGVTTFNLDEYEGLPAAHPQSYHAFMQQHLFDGLGLSELQTNILSGVSGDPLAECAEFEAKIRQAGGIDLQVLGIGSDGHIAFCEPGSSLAGRTSLVTLHPDTIDDNSRFFERNRLRTVLAINARNSSRLDMMKRGPNLRRFTTASWMKSPVSPNLRRLGPSRWCT